MVPVMVLLCDVLTLHQEIPNIIKTVVHDSIKDLLGTNSPCQFMADLFVDVLIPYLKKMSFIIVQEATC